MNSTAISPWNEMRPVQLCDYLKDTQEIPQAYLDRTLFLFTHLRDLQSFGAKSLVLWLYKVTKLNDALQHTLLQQEDLLSAWEKALCRKISKLNTSELSTLLYALGQFKRVPSASFLHALETALLYQMSILQPQDLTRILDVFEKLKIRPSRKFLSAWGKSCILKMKYFNAPHLFKSIFTLSALGIRPPITFLKAWCAIFIKKIDTFTPVELVGTLYALSLLGLKPPKNFFISMRKTFACQLKHLSPQDLSTSLHAFALLKTKPSELFFTNWKSASIKNIHAFTIENLSTILLAFYTFKIQPGKAFLAAWEDTYSHKVHSLHPQELTTHLYIFGQFLVKPGEAFLHAWEKTAIRKMRTFSAEDLTYTLYAFGTLAIKPTELFLDTWKTASLYKKNDFTPQNLINSLYGYLLLYAGVDGLLAKLDRLGVQALLHKMLRTLHSHQIQSREVNQQLHVILSVLVAQQSILLNKQWAEQALAQLEQNIQLQQQPPILKIQKIIFSVLSTMETGKDFTLGFWEKKTASFVDIVYSTHAKKIAIQVDGLPDYYKKQKEETSSTKLNTLLLKEVAGYEVIRIQYIYWKRLNTSGKVTYLKNRLDALETLLQKKETLAHNPLQTGECLEDDLRSYESRPFYTPLKHTAITPLPFAGSTITLERSNTLTCA